MNCTTFEEQLQAALDRGERPAGAALEQHAQSCMSCRAQLAEMDLLAAALPIWRSNIPGVDLRDAVVREVVGVHALACSAGTKRPPRRPSRLSSSRVAAALLAALAASLCLLLTPPARQAESPAVAQHASPARTPASASVVEDVAALWETARGQFEKLPPPPAAPQLWKPPAPEAAVEALRAPKTVVTWMGDVGQELEPVRASVGKAVDFLWQAVELDETSS